MTALPVLLIATLYSQTIYAPPTVCDGRDHPLAITTPWEPGPITIRGVSVSLSIDGDAETVGYAFVGSSNAEDGDLLSPVIVGKTAYEAIMYPAGTGFVFPGSSVSDPPHIDIHVSCHGLGNAMAWAVIFYTRDPAAAAGN